MTAPLRTIIMAAVAATAVACASSHNAGTAGPAGPAAQPPTTAAAARSPVSAQQAAAKIKAAVPEVTSLIAITEDNDSNNMIGRVNGYVAATVLVDSRTEECDTAKPGIICGAGVEQWPDEAAAQKRADYIKTMLSSAPILGTEYQTVKGNLLLRVSGKLKPSAAQAYQAAFSV